MKKYLFLLVFLVLLHFLFTLRTNNFFSTDDFFVLAHFKNKSVFDTTIDFLIHGDLFGFRKLTGYIIFGTIFKLFGANYLAFDLMMFMIQLLNLIVLFTVLRKLTNNDFNSFFASLIFNKYYFSYYSNIHEVSVFLFSFVTIFILSYFPKRFYFALVTFVLALFSRETAITLPLIIYFLKDKIKIDKKQLWTLFSISIIFAVYVLYFFIQGKINQVNSSYMLSFKIDDVVRGILFFFDLKIIVFCFALSIIFKTYRFIPILAIAVLTILPASLLVNRREIYYIYLPFGYLMLYMSLVLPKVNFKNFFIYILAMIVFGGRQILPKIAWQNFPNWQKESIVKVLKDKDISNLQRDARLMIETDTTDLFRGKI